MKYLSRRSFIKEHYGFTNSTSTQVSHLVADGKQHTGAFSELASWQRPDRVKKRRKPVYLVSEQSLNSKQNLEQHKPNLSQIPLITAFAPARSRTLLFLPGKIFLPSSGTQHVLDGHGVATGGFSQCFQWHWFAQARQKYIAFLAQFCFKTFFFPPLKMGLAKLTQNYKSLMQGLLYIP